MADPTFRVGIDTGGTFVDAVILGSDGTMSASKALAGVDDAVPAVLRDGASKLGITLEELLERCTSIVYGTTAGLNALLTRDGDKTGLITTKGHEDAVLIGRVHQKVAGLSAQEMTDVAHLHKPPPIVPRHLIRGIDERIDSSGRVLVDIDRAGVLDAVSELVRRGCRSIAVCFLWSFKNDAHEREALRLVAEHHPDLPVTLSVDAAPVLGEYERTATSVVTAYVKGSLERHMNTLESQLRRSGFSGRLYVMQASGGFATISEVIGSPAVTLGSGPAGGVMAARNAAESISASIISADMGGTSFDVGIIDEGEPELEDTPVLGKFHLAVPAVRIRSIGAGGGSIVRLDELGGLHVGPESAGAHPGPACFGRGGILPTVTDADLLLGRLDPEAHPDPRLQLDREAAEEVVGKLARALGMGIAETASGIVDVADGQMADLIRKATLESGHDPRRFTLVAFGGAGPVHAGAFAPDVGVGSAIVPPLASVLSAHGLAIAGWRKVYAASYLARMPVDAVTVQRHMTRLEDQAREDYASGGFAGRPTLERMVDMRYSRQTHVVRVSLPDGPLGAKTLQGAVERFASEYERLFGPGTGYPEAGVELVALGIVAEEPGAWAGFDAVDSGVATPRRPGRRRVYFDEWIDTPQHRLGHLSSGTVVEGPAVIDGMGTTLVVHPGQRVRIGARGAAEMTWSRS